MGLMRKAQRKKAKLRLGISGPAGSGKTFGALLTAYGITGDWDKICLIDTENHSGELYADYNKDGIEIGGYNYIPITPPYTPEKYISAIKECEDAGIECIIIDSLTHAWSGEGGLLDKKGQIEKSGKPGVNGWTAWRDITPLHNRLVETILGCSSHIISTLRAKMEYVQEKDEKGKNIVRKIGMNPIQREGMEYEFTVFVDVSQDHQATTSKDRTSLFDGKVFNLSHDTGRQLLRWLDTGIEPSVTDLQRKAMGRLAKELGAAPEMITALMETQFGVNNSHNLTAKQADQFIAYLESSKAAGQIAATQTEESREEQPNE